MKKNKLLYGIVILVGAICLTLTSCSEGHEHTFSTEQTKNETEHWHASTCGHNVKDSKEKHTYSEWELVNPEQQKRTCSICGYEDYLTNGLKYTLSNDDIYHIVSGTMNVMDLLIPSYYNDLPVKTIGRSAFSNCSSLKSIVIPNGVTSIGASTFYECKSLTNIVIPDTVIKIDDAAFKDCNGLTVFYTGSVTNWNNMNNNSSDIRDYMVAYYSEAKPTDTNYKYWHYIKGTPTLWS